MQRRSLLACATLVAGSLVGTGASAVPVTFSGRLINDTAYSADSVHVVAVQVTDSTGIAIGHVALPIGTPPDTVDYVIAFDNLGAPDTVLVAAALDVDGSGFDPDSLDNTVTNPDVVGWFPGQIDPVFVATASSLTGLDFALPTGEIRGDITFATGQTWAEVEACSVPNSWCPQMFAAVAGGTYVIPGLYEGPWVVQAFGPAMEVCYGDVTCITPTVITLTAHEVRTGIDLDFSLLAMDQRSWGRIKASYR